MKKIFFTANALFGRTFYTTDLVYDRREQEPFPPVNVYFCGSRILVQALLPGMTLQDIHLSVEHGILFLEGRILRKKGRYLHEERYSGQFKRRIVLGTDVLPDASMELRNGILQVELQKKEKP